MRGIEALRLTVLGSSGTYPGPGRACSGYLVTQGDTSLLLDCGSGVLSNLQKHIAIEDLTGILVTHMHNDHFSDLIPLGYALTYGGCQRPEPLPVFFPPGGYEIWEEMVAVIDESEGNFSSSFSFSEYQEVRDFRLGAFEIRTTLLHHYVPNYGVEVRGNGVLVYTGDTGPCPQLQDLASRSDLFLCEASLLDTEIPPDERGHLTAAEAGTAASQAGVLQLMLTHLMPDAVPHEAVKRARATFSGEILLAEQDQTHRVSPRLMHRFSGRRRRT